MKKTFVIGIAMFFYSLAAAGFPKIAVMSFENKAAYKVLLNDIDVGTADIFVTELAATKKFKVIDRAALQKLMEEKNVGQKGAVTDKIAAKIGKILGLEYIVMGSVNDYSVKSSDLDALGVGVKMYTASVELDVRVINTATAAIIAAATGQSKKSVKGTHINERSIIPTDLRIGSQEYNLSLIGHTLKDAVQDAVSKISEQIGNAWTGMIIKVTEDGTVIINGGENVDVAVNDVFVVMRKGQEIIDPETGESLGNEEDEIGEIQITEVKPKFAIAIITEGTGISKDDKIERIEKTNQDSFH